MPLETPEASLEYIDYSLSFMVLLPIRFPGDDINAFPSLTLSREWGCYPTFEPYAAE